MDKQNLKKGKLFIFIAGLLAVTIMGLNGIQVLAVGGEAKSAIKEDTQQQWNEFAKQTALMTQNRLETYLAYLNYYLQADVVDTGDTAQIVDWLHSVEDRRESVFDYVAWVDAAGTFSSDIGTLTHVTDRDYFQGIMQKGMTVFIDNPVTSKTSGKTIVHICKAAKRNGRTIGFFCGVVKIEHLAELLTGIQMSDKGYVAVYSSTGMLISTSGDSQAISEEMDALKTTDAESFEKITSNFGTSTSSIFETNNSKGEVQLTFTLPVEYTPWTVLISLNGNKVYKTATYVRILMLIGAICITVISLLLISIVLYRSISPLHVVESTIRGIATGDADLTKRIDVHSNNEIGRVVDGFNLFSEKLQQIVSTMKESKDKLVTVGEMMGNSADDTADAISQIINNIQNMNNQVGTQSQSVHETAGAVNQIASNIESLNRMIESQSEAVQQASAAVEEMIGNINSVDSNVQKMAKAFNDLETKAVSGVQIQNDVNVKIEEVQNESNALREANSVIKGIADQTNLLAMNAAIEAAHAGEAGKGFSVVADEIRKLSESSGQQSETIGNQLDKIIGSIEEIVAASNSAGDAFNDVAAGINSTNNLVLEITNAMTEQNEGSKQIAVALNSMNDTSDEVKTASFEMAEGNKAILDEIKNLQEATFSIKDSMEVMSSGARKISETGAALSQLSSEMNGSISAIGNQIDQFKV